jgi:preprotein translocase subunit SecE
MARDRKRAKQRQRRAAQRQPQPARAGRARREERAAPTPPAADEPDVVEAADEPGVVEAADEPEIVEATEDRPDADHTIPDLEHGSAEADIAKAAIAAGSVDPDEVREELEADIRRRPEGEVYADELGDDEGEVVSDGAAASAAVGRPARRERARVERRGGNRVTTFLRNSWEELKRVQWPDRRHVAQATTVVVVFVIVIGLFLGGADYVFSKLVDAII